MLLWSEYTLCNQTVDTDRGTVVGTSINLFGANIHIFRGIPYAKPPIGDRRFKPPQPLESNWTGVLNASQYSPSCPQKTPISRLNPQSSSSQINEDCLYLNVFTPQPDTNASLSVMVWIHGGRFLSGSGAWWQGQTIAAKEGIIVVTINYRVGIFGFLSTGETSSPRQFTANNGLLDQQLALKWVRNNIHQFGGNPNSVTIAGNSAGGMAVAFHTVIRSSYPYYQSVIMQSGQLLLNVGVYTLSQARGIFQQFAQKSNCSHDSTSLSVACIEKLSTDQVIAVQKNLVKKYFTLARPIIDGTLITGSPTFLLNNGLYNKNMKVLMGFTKDDGTYTFDTFAELPYGLDRLTFIFIIKQFYGSFGQNAVNAIVYKYTDWHNVTSLTANRDQLGIASTDVYFVTPAIQSANEYVKQGISTYLYVFDQKPFKSAYNPEYYGVTHATEIPYVFGYPINKPSYFLETFVAIDQSVSRKVMQMWANFVKTG